MIIGNFLLYLHYENIKDMIRPLKVNNDHIDSYWSIEDSRNMIKKKLSTIVEEFNMPVYLSGAEYFINCCKGFEDKDTGFPVDCGYGLTFESLNKYLGNHYGENNRNEYLVCVHTLPMENEKVYKNGNYINLNGDNTNSDYYDYTDFNKANADIENTFIGFDIFLLKSN